MFNVIPYAFRGLKTDFIVLRDEPFELTAFGRRQQAELARQAAVWVIRPADLVAEQAALGAQSRTQVSSLPTSAR